MCATVRMLFFAKKKGGGEGERVRTQHNRSSRGQCVASRHWSDVLLACRSATFGEDIV